MSIILRQFSFVLLLCFTASLFWCGDAECIEGTSHDNCASLVCSLLNDHNTSTQDASGSSARDCSCVCHVPTLVGNAIAVLVSPPVFQITSNLTLFIPASPSRTVYRPPLTA